MSDLIVAGKQVCRLMLVEINSDEDVAKGKAKQSNKFYNMYEQSNGLFEVEYGRVDSSCQRKTYPMGKWDSTIKSKIKKGYKDVTHLFQEELETAEDAGEEPTTSAIENKIIQRLVEQLQSYATNSVKQNYTISSKSVTQAMVDEAQACVDRLASIVKVGADIDAVNKELLHLYHIIPRKMGNVKEFLIDGTGLITTVTIDKANKLLENEQNTLDVMAGQVSINTKQQDTTTSSTTEKSDLLSIMGLEMVPAEDGDIAQIKDLLGPNVRQFKAAYRVVNKATQAKFDGNLNKATNKSCQLFWHGSRNQNWLNIISTGLLIRPAGAVHTGSMFGDGIYFADKAQKSIGYTSLRGSYWASGSDNSAYLALFNVHVGEQRHIKHHTRDCYSLSANKLTQTGHDSVFAHGGADLRNNEYIVYRPDQCTISFLVEITN